MSNPTMILKTPFGKWDWWPALQVIDYTPFRSARSTINITISEEYNTIEKATQLAVTAEWLQLVPVEREKLEKEFYDG